MSTDTSFSAPRGQQDIPALTGLRFVAAAYVVLFHTWPIFMPSRPGPLYWNQFVSLGYTSVSFFFVLSGFILATVYPSAGISRRFDKRAFWQARFARIYPIYAVSLLLSAPFAFVSTGNHTRVYVAAKAVFLVVGNGILLQAWHPALSGNWNRPSWSVSVEAFFYLLFPMLGGFLARFRNRPVATIIGLWLISVSSSLACIAFFPNLSASLPKLEIALFNPFLRLPEFLIGICFATLARHRQSSRIDKVAIVTIVSGLLLVPVLVRLPWLLVSNGLLAPLFGLVILYVGASVGGAAKFLQHPALVRLGHASFSLYLLHFPILFWMTFFVAGGTLTQRLTRAWPLEVNSPAFFIFYWMLAIGCSLVSYSVIESPARRLIRTWLSRPRSLSRPVVEVESGAIAR